jgi:hypothetical protein
MALELGIWSDFFVAQYLVSTANVTLGFDSTTQQGVHVNSIHLTGNGKCRVISLDRLPGGTAIDYSDHVLASINRLATIYCSFCDASFRVIRNQMMNNVSSIMTDRAAVNHTAVAKLNSAFGRTLIEVNCNLHPLDAFSSKCLNVLLNGEQKAGVTMKCLFSGTSCAQKLVLGMNTLRFKDGSGDPSGVRLMLDDAELPRGLISRYRGDRLHIIFSLCGVYFKHADLFVSFLKKCPTQLSQLY